MSMVSGNTQKKINNNNKIGLRTQTNEFYCYLLRFCRTMRKVIRECEEYNSTTDLFPLHLCFGQAFYCRAEISFPYKLNGYGIFADVCSPAVLYSSFNDTFKWHCTQARLVVIDFYSPRFTLSSHFVLGQ